MSLKEKFEEIRKGEVDQIDIIDLPMVLNARFSAIVSYVDELEARIKELERGKNDD